MLITLLNIFTLAFCILCASSASNAATQDPINSNQITIDSYENNTQKYIDATPNGATGELKEAWINAALNLIPQGGTVLEIGSGAGLAAKYMQMRGYSVHLTEAAPNFVDHLRNAGYAADLLNALTDEFGGPYNMIFANGVFHHFTRKELRLVFAKSHASMQKNGILAFSVKRGPGSGWTNEKLDAPRFFCYWEVEPLTLLLKKEHFEIIEIFSSATWLWVIAQAR